MFDYKLSTARNSYFLKIKENISEDNHLIILVVKFIYFPNLD